MARANRHYITPGSYPHADERNKLLDTPNTNGMMTRPAWMVPADCEQSSELFLLEISYEEPTRAF